MKKCFGYIRVSTAKQGERGVSLQEQRDAITRYAERNEIEIVEWFEERETAAKRGRPVFSRMLGKLKNGVAPGVVIHKIDRSARNLKDWADLGELIDRGVEVHFTNDSLDMTTRGGRLSADIQAVVAADYIRNLREETRKGFYGRLKQGVYPLPAPIGYADRGKGNPKEPDPVMAPLVKTAFELYATGTHSLSTLNDELHRRGLRNRNGARVTRNGLSVMLNNPFYVGIIRLRRTGENFQGAHEPLISKKLFDCVQNALAGKTVARHHVHDLLFRRLLTCGTCHRSLIGSIHKGRAYYRCQTKSCPTTCVREDAVREAILTAFARLRFTEEEMDTFRRLIRRAEGDWANRRERQVAALRLQLTQMDERRARLVDAYVDKLINRDTFTLRHETLLADRKTVEETLASLTGNDKTLERVKKSLELAATAWNLYEGASSEKRRDLLLTVTSNRVITGKNIDVAYNIPFNRIAERARFSNGGPYQDVHRTSSRFFEVFLRDCINCPDLPTFSGAQDSGTHA